MAQQKTYAGKPASSRQSLLRHSVITGFSHGRTVQETVNRLTFLLLADFVNTKVHMSVFILLQNRVLFQSTVLRAIPAEEVKINSHRVADRGELVDLRTILCILVAGNVLLCYLRPVHGGVGVCDVRKLLLRKVPTLPEILNPARAEVRLRDVGVLHFHPVVLVVCDVKSLLSKLAIQAAEIALISQVFTAACGGSVGNPDSRSGRTIFTGLCRRLRRRLSALAG